MMGMRVPGFDDVLRVLEGSAAQEVSLGEGAGPERVTAAESALGVRFPPEYAAFLTKVGWARIGSLAIFGLGGDAPDDLDLLTANRNGDAVRAGLIRVARDEDGSLFCLDGEHQGPYESPLYACDGAEPAYVNHNFSSWLMMLAAGPGEPA
jgi:SMI1 / KNR4 family (SUKH-1)